MCLCPQAFQMKMKVLGLSFHLFLMKVATWSLTFLDVGVPEMLCTVGDAGATGKTLPKDFLD